MTGKLIDDKTLAQLVRKARDEYPPGAHRVFAINIYWAIADTEFESLPEVVDEEVDEILSDLPTSVEDEESKNNDN